MMISSILWLANNVCVFDLVIFIKISIQYWTVSFQTWHYLSLICKQAVNNITEQLRHKLKLGSLSFLAFCSSKIEFLWLLDSYVLSLDIDL